MSVLPPRRRGAGQTELRASWRSGEELTGGQPCRKNRRQFIRCSTIWV